MKWPFGDVATRQDSLCTAHAQIQHRARGQQESGGVQTRISQKTNCVMEQSSAKDVATEEYVMEELLAKDMATKEYVVEEFIVGICPPLAHLVGKTKEKRYSPLVDSGYRTDRELGALWRELQDEHREACDFLGKEVEGPAAVEVGGIGEGSTYYGEALFGGWRCPPVLGSTPVLGFLTDPDDQFKASHWSTPLDFAACSQLSRLFSAFTPVLDFGTCCWL